MRGLFRLKGWWDGQLREVALIQKKGAKGKFVTNHDGDYIGVIDDVRGVVRQDNDARLYFLPQVEQLENR
jgi:hypothetical protein